MTRKVVSVFGGSSPLEGEAAYEDAHHLGRLLAQAGLAVATGGYKGVMEAASRGAAEAGGHVIGVTSDRIVTFTGDGRVNRWVAETVNYASLRERLSHLVEYCDAAIALPGGIGTLSEVALMWSLLQTGEIARKPFVLVGPHWKAVMEGFYSGAQGYIRAQDWGLLSFAATVDEAAGMVSRIL